MLNLDTKITLNEQTIKSPNLCDRFDKDELDRIGAHVLEGYKRDKQSRAPWERRTEAAMDLAMQVVKDKNFPWPSCSNIAFPLVTIATMQFHARAYPAIVSGTSIVKYRVIGDDPEGEKRKRADRIGGHMSYQLLEEDSAWESQQDTLLINLAIVGTVFKKSYYSASESHNVSELVLAKDLVLDYWAKTVEKCPRKTHIVPLFRNDIHERVLRGVFQDVTREAWYSQPPTTSVETQQQSKDNRQGQIPPGEGDDTTPFITLEQHCLLDLDGDGYAEPYIATIEESSNTLLRLVTRFERMEDIDRTAASKIIRITPMEYFTKYPFIPSPDGGIYDIGFGVLLGPCNESVNSLINELVDAGTMSNSAGGFLGRGAKLRGGVYTFAPLEWKRVDSTGDDLKKSIFPLPVREPSMVLFQLLSLLITYTNRISSSTEAMAGENPGQNTPAETSRNMIEQGQKIYAGIFKRVWRSMKEEFKKLFILNAIYMTSKQSFGEKGQYVLREDYLGKPGDVMPVADPNIVSDSIQFAQAQALKQAAMTTPGYNLEVVERRYLKAIKVDGIDEVYPGKDKVPPLPNFKMQVEMMKTQVKQADLQLKQKMFVMEMIETSKLNKAKITQLEAQAMKFAAEAEGIETGHMIAAFEASIGALKANDEVLVKRIELLMKGMEHDEARQDASGGGIPGMANLSGNAGASQAAAAPAAGA